MRLRDIVFISFVIILVAFIGCSSTKGGLLNPVIPDSSSLEADDDTPWGTYDLYIDVEDMLVNVLNNRIAEPHVDVTGYLLPPLCDDCVSGTVLGWDPVTRILSLDIAIHNPSELTAYDVRGILFLDDPATHTVANPDGYTKRFDDSDPKDINPFIYWNEGGDAWEFSAGATLNEEVQIVMPTPMNFQIEFAVEASFPFNSKDPLYFDEINLSGDIYDTGWSVDLEVGVVDWQDDVSCVCVDLSPFGPGNIEFPLALDVDGLWKGHHEYEPGMGYSLPELGTYHIPIRAIDSVSKYDLYDYVEADVVEDNDPPVWIDKVGITNVAIGAGRAVVYHDLALDPSCEVEYYLYYSETSSPYDGDYVTVTGAAHYTIAPLTNGIEYVFGVRAGDQAGNVGNNVNFRTGTPQALQLLWARTVAAEINSNPAVVDVDGDQDQDVIFGSDDGRVYAVDGSTGDIGWYQMTGGSVVGSPAMVDINLDGLPDVVIGAGDGKLYGIRGTNGTVLGTFQTQNVIEASPVIVDFDENGKPDVFIASTDGKVYGLSIASLSNFATYNAGTPIFATPALAYLNTDEYVDVAVCAGGNVAGVSGTSANDLWTTNLGTTSMTGSPAMAAFNDDGISDLVIGTPFGLYVLDGSDGSLIWSVDGMGIDFETDPALADLSGDGRADVVISGRVAGIFAFNGVDGSLMWMAEGDPVVPTSPIIADVTGDGKLDVIAGSADMHLRIYNGDDGLILGSFATSLAGAVTTTPAIGDVNHDGYIDIVFGTEERTIFAITTNKAIPGSVDLLPWPKFHRNLYNQGNLAASLMPSW